MRVLVNVLTLIAAVIGFLVFCFIVWTLGRYGFGDGRGLAMIPFQFLAVVACIVALILGLIGYFMARAGERDADVASDIGVGIGLSGVLSYLLMLALT